MRNTRGPWTTMPALIKVGRAKLTDIFFPWIEISNYMQFSGKRRCLFQQLSKQTPTGFLGQKPLFFGHTIAAVPRMIVTCWDSPLSQQLCGQERKEKSRALSVPTCGKNPHGTSKFQFVALFGLKYWIAIPKIKIHVFSNWQIFFSDF